MSAGGKKRSYGAVNYWITVAAILPFLVMIITGVVVQATYHFGRHPADYQVMGIAGAGWVNAHRLSSVAAIACVAFHLYLHREYIGNVLLKKYQREDRAEYERTSGSSSSSR
jgi:cytochrome b subunit of formate dehydrogenase